MSKWTDKDFWLGRTEDQKQRRAEAVEGMKKARDDFKDATAETKEKFASAGEAKRERDDQRREQYDADKAKRAEDWEVTKDDLRADREGRGLGGWGRKKKPDGDV